LHNSMVRFCAQSSLSCNELKLNIKILKQPESQGVMNRDEGAYHAVEPRLRQFAVLYANSSSRKTAAAVETSLKI